MARSLLDKHKKKPATPSTQDPLRLIPGGKDPHKSGRFTDADWYYVHSYWKSSLFNELYLRDDFQRLRSNELSRYEEGFQTFLNRLLRLCDQKRDEKFHTWNEDQTIRSWIMPVLEKLGWWDADTDPVIPELTFTVPDGDKKRTYRPDCAFVASQMVKGAIQEKAPAERLEYARRYVTLTVEAKYWDRIRKYDKQDSEIGTKSDVTKSRKSDSASSLSPGGQILTYLKYLKNDDPPRNHFGIATDGKVWRLYHVDRPEDKFFEFDLGKLFFEITSERTISDLKAKQYLHIEEAARYFYYIFSKAALYSEKNEPTLVDDLFAYSKKYVEKAEEDLKERFLTAMRYACNGFNRALAETGEKVDLELIRDVAESHIFNILFLKSCEAKGVIRYEANTDIAITPIIERIAAFDSSDSIDDKTNESLNLSPAFKEFNYQNSGVQLHDRILKLTDIVENGGRLESGIEIAAFKESIFSKGEKSLLSKYKLTNIETVKLLYALGYMEENNKFRQIPYNIFTPEQLGSIYESFLEFKISRAEEDLEFQASQWKPLRKKTHDRLKRGEVVKHPIARTGELFFTPNNADRKASGAYYTPDYIVKYLISNVLRAHCRGKKADEILQLRICDPAMGSGHFLTGALRFLTDEYLNALENEPVGKQKTLPQAKRDILDACIHGVDVNHRAVRLAKMALWLETAHSGTKLERLDDQLYCGNSLISTRPKYNRNFDWKAEIFDKKGIRGFDCIIGNPPWESLKVNDDEFFAKYIKDVNKKTAKADKKKKREELFAKNPEIKKEYDDYVARIRLIQDVIEKDFKLQDVEIEDFATGMAEPNCYKAFLERAYGLLKDGGTMGLIVPAGILTDIGSTLLRKAFLDNFHNRTVLQFKKNSKVFKDVTQSFVFLLGTSGDPDEMITLAKPFSSGEEFKNWKGDTIPLSRAAIDGISPVITPIVFLSSPEEESVLAKMSKFPKVLNYIKDDKFKLIPRCGSNTTYIADCRGQKGKGIAVAKGEDVQRFTYEKTSTWWLSRQAIADRKRVDLGGSKVGICMIAGTTDPRRLRVGILPDEVWPINSVNYFLPNETLTDDAKYYLVGVLNSKVEEFLLRMVSQNNNINIFAVKHLVIPRYDSNNETIRNIVSTARSLETKYSKEKERELDSFVYKLFDLSEKEIGYIDGLYPLSKA